MWARHWYDHPHVLPFFVTPYMFASWSVQLDEWRDMNVLTPDPPPHFSVFRTSSILSRDHPPDKKPKSDKASVPPAQDFDSTGKLFCLSVFPLPLASLLAFPALFTDPNELWLVRLEKCALCVGYVGNWSALCFSHYRWALRMATVVLCSRPRRRVIAEALTQTVLWFSLPDHKLCTCSWPCLLAVRRHYQRRETLFFHQLLSRGEVSCMSFMWCACWVTTY